MDESDAALVERARSRDEAAFSALYHRYNPMAFRVASGLTGDPSVAEDVAQEAFARAFRTINRLRPDVSFTTWLYRSLVWAAHTDTKRRRRWRSIAGLLQRFQADEEDPYPKTDTALSLLQALGTLSPRLREAVVLRYYLDLSEVEIAAIAGVPRGTVKSRLSRALRRLGAEPGVGLEHNQVPKGGIARPDEC